MAVQDQEHRAWGVVQQPAAEVDEHRPVQAAVIGGKPQLALGGHRRDQVDPEPIVVGGHHGVCPISAQVIPVSQAKITCH